MRERADRANATAGLRRTSEARFWSLVDLLFLRQTEPARPAKWIRPPKVSAATGVDALCSDFGSEPFPSSAGTEPTQWPTARWPASPGRWFWSDNSAKPATAGSPNSKQPPWHPRPRPAWAPLPPSSCCLSQSEMTRAPVTCSSYLSFPICIVPFYIDQMLQKKKKCFHYVLVTVNTNKFKTFTQRYLGFLVSFYSLGKQLYGAVKASRTWLCHLFSGDSQRGGAVRQQQLLINAESHYL